MKWPLSIFSFETLKGSLAPTRAVCLALLLLVVVNVLVKRAIDSDLLYVSNPRLMVTKGIESLVESEAELWWIGNSTMAAGVDQTVIADAAVKDSVFLELGSATLEATVALAVNAIEQSSRKPEKLILFFTKDDLNAHGERAVASRRYLEALQGESLKDRVESWVPVYTARFAIVKGGRDFFASTLKHGPKSQDKVEEAVVHRDLSSDFDTTYLNNLGRDFAPQVINFNRLAELAGAYGTKIYFVSPPVTNAVVKWQAENVPSYPWSDIVSGIEALLEFSNMIVVDYSGLLPSTTQYFKDVYHLNQFGAKEFSKQLATELFDASS